MKRLIPLLTLAAATLLAAPALADHRYGYGQAYGSQHQGHRHSGRCDHGTQSGYGHGYGYDHDRRHGSYSYQPFYGQYDRPWRRWDRRHHEPRRYYSNNHYRSDYRGHRHDHRPIAFVEPRLRHAWRWCGHHGGWFRIGDFVIAY